MSRIRVARACWLGRRNYLEVVELQRELVAVRASDAVGDTVLLLEHEPVITLGRHAKREHLLASEEALCAAGISVVQTERGGDVTLHAPGQLVGYPILDLKPDRCQVPRYVRQLGQIMIELARPYGVRAGFVEGLVGVWADADRPTEWRGMAQASRPVKIGALGVRLHHWITMHGFAFNLTTDLAGYRWIVPCGIAEHGVGSIASLTGLQPAVAEVALGAAPLLAESLEYAIAEVEDLAGTADLARVLR